jgi:DNA-binding transcriptional LysR family regulator
LSNAIKALEGELGSALVQRSPFSLTPAGKAILPHFRGALRHIRQARKAGTKVHRPDEVSLVQL